uniref:Uncharacterized protein n=1 Tax=Nothobranchius furzeri TaxID=105023 RepID=A0A1A8VGF4_NOTFU
MSDERTDSCLHPQHFTQPRTQLTSQARLGCARIGSNPPGFGSIPGFLSKEDTRKVFISLLKWSEVSCGFKEDGKIKRQTPGGVEE